MKETKRNMWSRVALLAVMLMVIALCVPADKVSAASYNGVDYSAVYNAEYYYENNPDLAEAFGWDEDALWSHFITSGMKEGRQASGEFNPYEYASRYPDVREAYGDNMEAYYMHYVQFGKPEGRSGLTYSLLDFASVFDPQNYMNRNLDVRAAYGDDIYDALQHFVNNGIKEGRQAINTFDVRAYKNANPDLQAIYGDDYQSYVNHYIQYGQYEGRVTTDAASVSCGNGTMEETYAPVFDAQYYLTHNSDVAEVYQGSETGALLHFIGSGMAEGRRGSTEFNLTYYKDNNPDVVAAYGDNNVAYYLHYIRNGKAEGRKGSRYIATDNSGNLNPKTTTGIDVSSWQGEIDWDKVVADEEANIGFAIIRVGWGDNEKSQDDKWAIRNMDECERLGIPYGVYLFSYATNMDEAQSESDHLLRMLEDRNPSMGVYIDIEASEYYQNHDIDPYSEDGRRVITDITKKILTNVSNAGYIAGFYANVNYCRNILYIDELTGYRWIAGYGDYCDTCLDMGAIMWQYSSTGSVDGIEGNVDMNAYLGDL